MPRLIVVQTAAWDADRRAVVAAPVRVLVPSDPPRAEWLALMLDDADGTGIDCDDDALTVVSDAMDAALCAHWPALCDDVRAKAAA